MKLIQPGGVAFFAFFALVPGVAVGGALGMAVLMCVTALAAIRPSRLRQVVENRPLPLLLILALALWAMTTTLWSPLPWDDQVAKLAVLVPLGAVFVGSAASELGTRRLVLAGAIAGAVVLAPLLWVEATHDMVLNHAAQADQRVDLLLRNGGRGTTVLLALLWPAAGALLAMGGAWRLALAAVLIAAAAWLSPQFDQLANAAAFGAGLAAFAIGYAAPRLGVLAMSGGLAVWLLAAPFVSPILAANQRLVDALPLSAAIRTQIWDYVSARTMQQPWVGHGLEASRTITDRLDVRGLNVMAVPIHPHSASLQIWFETGLVGAVLAAGALITGGLWLARRFAGDRPGAAAACASLASMGVIANVSYGIWAEWWIATLFVSAALVGALAFDRGRSAP